jgi:hypothetical protein
MRKFTENLELPSNHKIGDKVTLDFYDAGELINCVVSEVNFGEGDVSYDIEITVKEHWKTEEELKTIIKAVDATFVKKY